MRRIAALAAAIGLAAGIAGSGPVLAAPSTPSFLGDFTLLWNTAPGVTLELGRVHAQLRVPSETRVVPGTYNYTAAPELGIAGYEVQALIGETAFWYDPEHEGGARFAFGSGVRCDYAGPPRAMCGDFAIMFIDVLDPSKPDEVAFAYAYLNTGWAFAEWRTVGPGSFKMAGEFPTGCPFFWCQS